MQCSIILGLQLACCSTKAVVTLPRTRLGLWPPQLLSLVRLVCIPQDGLRGEYGSFRKWEISILTSSTFDNESLESESLSSLGLQIDIMEFWCCSRSPTTSSSYDSSYLSDPFFINSIFITVFESAIGEDKLPNCGTFDLIKLLWIITSRTSKF